MRWFPYFVAAGVCVPWLYFIVTGTHPATETSTASIAGLAILGAAFLLGWACEVAEEDIPQALAISVLALVAVLPEYAVDASFAWKAATDPSFAPYAIANMTGSNRLLIGIGWPVLSVLYYLRTRRKEIELPKDMGAEVAVLFLATLYAIVPVVRGSLTLVDTAIYLVLYISYLIAASRAEEHEGETVGPAAVLAAQPVAVRRAGVLVMLVYAATVIFVAAEPFAESLVGTGRHWGIDEFVLVQWVAPLASESPEFVVALLMIWKGAGDRGMRTLVSSKLNQWTLLVGTLSLVYSIAKGGPAALPFDDRQTVEVLLTAAQCVFAVVVLADLRLSLWQSFALLALFLFQAIFQHTHLWVSALYLLLSAGILVVDKPSRDGLFSSFRTFWLMLINRKPPSMGH